MNGQNFFFFFPLLLFCLTYNLGNTQTVEIKIIQSDESDYVKHIQKSGLSFNALVSLEGADNNVAYNWEVFRQNRLAGCGDLIERIEKPTNSNTIRISPGRIRLIVGNNNTARLRTTNSNIPEGKYCFEIRASHPTLSGDVYRKKVILIVRKPREMVILVDKSLSMKCDSVNANFAESANSSTNCDDDFGQEKARWFILRDALKNYVHSFGADDNQLVQGDSMSLVFFSNVANQNNLSNLNATNNFLTEIDCGEGEQEPVLLCAMDEETDSFGENGTSIGAGILKAYQILVPEGESELERNLRQTNKSQDIILLTDGIQNEFPILQKLFDNMFILFGTGLGAERVNMQSTVYNNIKLYSFPFWSFANIPLQNLLEDISSGEGFFVSETGVPSASKTFLA